MRSLLRKKGGYVLVGDQVRLVGIDWQDARALIDSVQPRTTELHDPKVSNVDHFAVVFAVSHPPFEAYQATRFLVAAEAAGVACTIVLNKQDLISDVELDTLVRRVHSWGYEALPTSVQSGSGLAQIKEALVGRTTVLAGPSGVGKSSIINALRAASFDDSQRIRLARFQRHMAEEYDWDVLARSDTEAPDEPDRLGDMFVLPSLAGEGVETSSTPCSGGASSQQSGRRQRSENIYGAQALQAVGNVGAKSRRGRHTTRSAVLLDLPGGGLLVDTPGFNYPSMLGANSKNLGDYFPEIRNALKDATCQFTDCVHIHEPGCAVGHDWERFDMYCRLREELESREQVDAERQVSKRKKQGTTKRKSKRGGQEIELARLESKAHRRESRNQSKVLLQARWLDEQDISAFWSEESS